MVPLMQDDSLPRPAEPAKLPPATHPPVTPAATDNPPVNTLTPEEQMALFEKELKETDWGHQPC